MKRPLPPLLPAVLPLPLILSKAEMKLPPWGSQRAKPPESAARALPLRSLTSWKLSRNAQAGEHPQAVLFAPQPRPSCSFSGQTGELSDTQLQDLKDNWSTISFDADQILNNLEEIRVLTEDAGCAEAAKDAASHKNAAANWKAVSQALDNILK